MNAVQGWFWPGTEAFMSYGAFDRDVIGGKTPLRLSPIKGITNATAILSKQFSEETANKALAAGQKGDGFASFAKYFTKNPSRQQLSKAAGIFASSGGGV